MDLWCGCFSLKMHAKMKELGPIGGRGPIGGVDLQCGHFSPKMFAKMKELGPVRGRDAPLNPPMDVLFVDKSKLNLIYDICNCRVKIITHVMHVTHC